MYQDGGLKLVRSGVRLPGPRQAYAPRKRIAIAAAADFAQFTYQEFPNDESSENKTMQGEKTNMDIRYSANQRGVKRCATQELWDEVLIQNPYRPDSVQAFDNMDTAPAAEVR